MSIHKDIVTISGISHLSVEECLQYKKDLFPNMKLIDNFQGATSAPNCFEDLIKRVRESSHDLNKHIAVVITKPPETVLLILSPLALKESPKFGVFDSHPRPQLGLTGSYLLSSSDSAEITSHLRALFPCGSSRSLTSLWEEMYSAYEASVFQLND
jgi:hypothetical protein